MASFLAVCRRIDRSVLGLCVAQAIAFATCAVVDSEYAAIGLFLTPTLIAGLVIAAFQFDYYADLEDRIELSADGASLRA